MTTSIEKLIAGAWNKLVSRPDPQTETAGLDLGYLVTEGRTTQRHLYVPHIKRTEHIAILGKTGTGKTSLQRHIKKQDIEAGRGFMDFDFHGETTPYLLRLVSKQERRTGRDLSHKLIVIEPADLDYAVGWNPLQQRPDREIFVQVAEFAQILKQRWHVQLGARTEELLRNSLHVLSDASQTPIEIHLLLTNAGFRAKCLQKTRNPEVREYFAARYNRASDGMQAVLREPILNKISAFTADPHFRHIIGQQQSTFSLAEAIDRGDWIFWNLGKGRLGEEAVTLGGMCFTKMKNDLFGRVNRALFSINADETQNLVPIDTGFETILAEARKFGISICSANQYIDQFPPQMRAAVLAVGTHIFFQLSSADADKVAAALDGGKTLSEMLKNLPQRHLIVKSGHYRWQHAVVPQIEEPNDDYSDLYNRCRARWAKRRTEIEREIRERHTTATAASRDGGLHDWD